MTDLHNINSITLNYKKVNDVSTSKINISTSEISNLSKTSLLTPYSLPLTTTLPDYDSEDYKNEIITSEAIKSLINSDSNLNVTIDQMETSNTYYGKTEETVFTNSYLSPINNLDVPYYLEVTSTNDLTSTNASAYVLIVSNSEFVSSEVSNALKFETNNNNNKFIDNITLNNLCVEQITAKITDTNQITIFANNEPIYNYVTDSSISEFDESECLNVVYLNKNSDFVDNIKAVYKNDSNVYEDCYLDNGVVLEKSTIKDLKYSFSFELYKYVIAVGITLNYTLLNAEEETTDKIVIQAPVTVAVPVITNQKPIYDVQEIIRNTVSYLNNVFISESETTLNLYSCLETIHEVPAIAAHISSDAIKYFALNGYEITYSGSGSYIKMQNGEDFKLDINSGYVITSGNIIIYETGGIITYKIYDDTAGEYYNVNYIYCEKYTERQLLTNPEECRDIIAPIIELTYDLYNIDNEKSTVSESIIQCNELIELGIKLNGESEYIRVSEDTEFNDSTNASRIIHAINIYRYSADVIGYKLANGDNGIVYYKTSTGENKQVIDFITYYKAIIFTYKNKMSTSYKCDDAFISKYICINDKKYPIVYYNGLEIDKSITDIKFNSKRLVYGNEVIIGCVTFSGIENPYALVIGSEDKENYNIIKSLTDNSVIIKNKSYS